MIPGPINIIKCPACGQHQLSKSLRSGNTIGARYFSDGKRVAPMLPEYPYFVKCPFCSIFFKINDKQIVGKNSEFERGYEKPFVKFLTVNEYCQAISEGLYNGNESDLLSLRISLWRRYNDRHDGQREYEFGRERFETDKATEKEIYEDNCRKILSMMAENTDDENLLLCAEVWRNLGNFDKCNSLLKEIKEPEKYRRYISTIKAACDTENTLTVELTS